MFEQSVPTTSKVIVFVCSPALQSELFRLKFHSLGSKLQKILEFNLIITDDYFVPAVEYFAAFLKLSENIAGVIYVTLPIGEFLGAHAFTR